ncbi:MAG: lytic murein transglycosylase B [Gammaproteobacteria bacterium]
MLKQFLILTLIFLIPTSFAATPFGERKDVQTFIDHMSTQYHFSKKSLTTLFDQVKPRPQVIMSIKKPLETNPWNIYRHLFITQTKIDDGVAFWNKYDKALTRAQKEYGVPASLIVATIGIETNYGTKTGQYRVIDALSDIAFNYPKRAKYFQYQLEQFLLLTREKHLNPLDVKGSYAGAIGQPQFMPDSYRKYAVDFSKNGKIDLSHDEIDVIGSIANYYHEHDWQTGQKIAMPAEVSGDKYQSLIPNDRHHLYTMKQLNDDGVTLNNPPTKLDNQVMFLALKTIYGQRYWVGFHNFRVIMRYNSSPLYAMAVTQLANKITDEKNHAKTPA